jgi:hypothetical protein
VKEQVSGSLLVSAIQDALCKDKRLKPPKKLSHKFPARH